MRSLIMVGAAVFGTMAVAGIAACTVTSTTDNGDAGPTTDAATQDGSPGVDGSSNDGSSNDGATTDAPVDGSTAPTLKGKVAVTIDTAPAVDGGANTANVGILDLVARGQPTAISHGSQVWDEYGVFTPDGQNVVYLRANAGAGETFPTTIRAVKTDGTSERDVVACETLCYNVAAGNDGNVWFADAANLQAIPVIKSVPLAGGTATPWAGNTTCVIQSFATTPDHSKLIIDYGASNDAACLPATLGIYVVPVGSTTLPATHVLINDPRVDPASIANVTMTTAGDRFYFTARAASDGGLLPAKIFSSKVDGSDVRIELDPGSQELNAFTITSDGAFFLALFSVGNPTSAQSLQAFQVGATSATPIQLGNVSIFASLAWTP